MSYINQFFSGKAAFKTLYFNSANLGSSLALKEHFLNLLNHYRPDMQNIVLLCIGSDRSTGDSLGPLIGYKLEKYHINSINIYGTLESPVHASNLAYYLDAIDNDYPNPFIIAIDASLGTKEHVGYITLGTGPLRPGLGVNKLLPDVGDIHFTGIVNFTGSEMVENLLLQTTRLSKVMLLADTISKAILYGLTEYNGG